MIPGGGGLAGPLSPARGAWGRASWATPDYLQVYGQAVPARTSSRLPLWNADQRRRFGIAFWPAWGVVMGVIVGTWNPLAGLVLASLGILAGVAAGRGWEEPEAPLVASHPERREEA